MGARLVGHQVGHDAPSHELGQDVGGVAEEADRERPPFADRGARPREGLVQALRHDVEVARLEAPLDPVAVHLDRDHHALVHRRRERLGAAHAPEAGGEDEPALQAAAEVLPGGLREGLVGALQDPLGPDVDPGARRHLPVHHQALAVELVEVLPGRPGRHEHGVGDQHARRLRVRSEDADRLARLDEQRLVVPQLAQRAHDGVVAGPVARGLADPAVDDEVLRALGHLGVEVVHEHAQRGLLLPGLAGDRGSARGPDGAHGACGRHITHLGLSPPSSWVGS